MASQILLIIAHGSRSPAWNHAIETFCIHLQTHHFQNEPFHEVHGCFLEHAQPTIQDALRMLCQSSNERIIALPLFLSVGQHVAEDIPAEVNAVANFLEKKEKVTLYQYQGTPIYLVEPPPTIELLADNIERRAKRFTSSMNGSGLLVVYYGAKKHIEQWNRMASLVQSRLTERFPHTLVQWGYGGDAVDFSPVPLADILIRMAQTVRPVVILPALVASGVVQNEIIPSAIAYAGLEAQIIYPHDAILPDEEMERFIAHYASRF